MTVSPNFFALNCKVVPTNMYLRTYSKINTFVKYLGEKKRWFHDG